MPAIVNQADAAREFGKVEAAFVKRHGTSNQYERLCVGLLPEAELLSLVRYELFLSFAPFRRWVKLEAGDVRHERSCSGGEVRFVTQEPGSLTHDEWSLFKQITNAIDAANSGVLNEHRTKATVSLVEHVGRCSVCPAETFGRAASVRIEWAGRPLSREYTLEAM
jgi:hypothetical protein